MPGEQIPDLNSGLYSETSQDNDPPTRRAAIYARTSTPSQEFGYSIDEQTRQCVERCQAMDWTIAFVHRDEAKSVKDTDRPMFQEMLTQARRGLIDVVVFWKLDRFSRSIMHAVQLEKQFREWGVALHSVTEQIDTTTASGQFNFRNLANTAEFEREMIRQRTKMGHAARATEGKWPNGKPPLGYDIGPDGRLKINEPESKLVRWIFKEYLETQSMATVADQLNEKRESGDRKKWTPAAVSETLQNQLYTGEYIVGEVTRSEPEYRILSQEVFDEAKRVRNRYQRSGSHSREQMATRRKESRTHRILNQYQEWIQ
jgi:site-specific DNA recombinase